NVFVPADSRQSPSIKTGCDFMATLKESVNKGAGAGPGQKHHSPDEQEDNDDRRQPPSLVVAKEIDELPENSDWLLFGLLLECIFGSGRRGLFDLRHAGIRLTQR